MHADGSGVVDAPGLPRGLSARTVWEPLRINHYVVKSWEEFYWRKRPRGRATRWDRPRDAAFFAAHDRNEVTDPAPAWLVRAAEEEDRRIEAALRRGRSPGLAAWQARLAALARPDRVRGEIEAIEIRGRSALIRGWALTPGNGAEEFAVRVMFDGETAEQGQRGGHAGLRSGHLTVQLTPPDRSKAREFFRAAGAHRVPGP